MAVITQRAGVKETVRQKREREQELLVWPDLVFVEFICAILFTVTFVILSVLFNAPLLNKANPAITPDPSKAPWYFMNLQELLLHMDKGLAGVIVPTILIIGLIAVPYIDRKNDGQGAWFATPNAVKITAFAFAWASIWITWLILWDDSAHVRVYQRLPYLWGVDASQVENQWQWPSDRENPWYDDFWATEWASGAIDAVSDFVFLKNRLAVRDEWEWSMPVPWQASGGDGSLDWPQDFRRVPVPLNGTWIWEFDDPVDSWMPGWMRTFYWYDVYLDIPAITAEWVMPIMAMVLLPLLMVIILFKIGWAKNTRDSMIALFTGFILVYTALTIIGVAFRGEGQELVPPTSVPNLEDNPAIYHYTPPSDTQFALTDAAPEVGRHG
jgi:hypothetical protein